MYRWWCWPEREIIFPAATTSQTSPQHSHQVITIRAGNSLIRSFAPLHSNQLSDCERFPQIAQVAQWAMLMINEWMSDVSKSLRSLTTKERCERITQVAHQKLATMSDSLRSLTKNERMSKSLVFLSESLIGSFFCKKLAIRSVNCWANSQPWSQ